MKTEGCRYFQQLSSVPDHFVTLGIDLFEDKSSLKFASFESKN